MSSVVVGQATIDVVATAMTMTAAWFVWIATMEGRAIPITMEPVTVAIVAAAVARCADPAVTIEVPMDVDTVVVPRAEVVPLLRIAPTIVPTFW